MQIVLALFSLLLAAFFFAVAIGCFRIGGVGGRFFLPPWELFRRSRCRFLYAGCARSRRDGLGTLDDGDGAKSFRLLRPACPRCGDRMTRFDWTAIGNLWRVPAVVAAAMIRGHFPLWAFVSGVPSAAGGLLPRSTRAAAGRWR